MVTLINDIFPSNTSPQEYFRGLPINISKSNNLRESLKLQQQTPGRLRYIIHTKLGEGPRIFTHDSEHLLTENGLPKKLQN